MEKIRVAIIFGGCSSEYEVSLKSAHSVITHLDKEKYEVTIIGIDPEGGWYHFEGEPEKILEDTWLNMLDCTPVTLSLKRGRRVFLEVHGSHIEEIPVDVIFPVLHGKNGEDGTLQGLLELIDIPVVGCGLLSSAICMDKDIAHKIAKEAGIRVPSSVLLERKGVRGIEDISYPVFVKPVRSGSSLGISMVKTAVDLEKAVDDAFKHDDKVIIEERIDGVEIGCAIVGNEDLIVGELDEIEISEDFFSYGEKYALTSSTIHMPARLDEETTKRLKETAKMLYRVLRCQGYARVDMFLSKDGEIFFNEVNTIPGFTPHSRFPKMLSGIGWSFSYILDALIALAL